AHTAPARPADQEQQAGEQDQSGKADHAGQQQLTEDEPIETELVEHGAAHPADAGTTAPRGFAHALRARRV
ncbi:hypothetical protein CATMIT_01596, partial [Catenibacterium mitsuokai DSM 15897]